MHIVTARVPGAARLARLPELSRMARQRVKWMDHYRGHGQNAALTCRYFGISRQTFYRWKRRYNPGDLASLEERSHRPKRLRQPTWSRELSLAVLHLREQYPRWGKDKLVMLLRDGGWQVSTSMVGRILSHLKARGVLREPLRSGVSTRKRLWQRPYAVRKPKGYAVQQPGDLVQVDTLDVRPLPGMVLKHFTARDVDSRWDVIEVHTRATAKTASAFLDAIQERMPFPPSGQSRWTAVASSRQPLRPSASAGVFASLSCLPDPPSSTGASSAPSVPIPKSSMKSPTSPSTSPP